MVTKVHTTTAEQAPESVMAVYQDVLEAHLANNRSEHYQRLVRVTEHGTTDIVDAVEFHAGSEVRGTFLAPRALLTEERDDLRDELDPHVLGTTDAVDVVALHYLFTDGDGDGGGDGE